MIISFPFIFLEGKITFATTKKKQERYLFDPVPNPTTANGGTRATSHRQPQPASATPLCIFETPILPIMASLGFNEFFFAFGMGPQAGHYFFFFVLIKKWAFLKNSGSNPQTCLFWVGLLWAFHKGWNPLDEILATPLNIGNIFKNPL